MLNKKAFINYGLFSFFFIITLCVSNDSNAQSCSDPVNVVCLQNSGHFDQDEKNVVCYDDNMTPVWSIANELPITTILGEREGLFIYTIQNEVAIVTNDLTVALPLEDGETILGGTDIGSAMQEIAILAKDANQMGTIKVYEGNESDDSIIMTQETAEENRIPNPVWMLGGSTSDMNGAVFVGTENDGIYKVNTDPGFDSHISMNDIYTAAGQTSGTLGAVHLMESNASTGEYSIALTLVQSNQSTVLNWNYSASTNSSTLQAVLTNVPFEIGGIYATDSTIAITAPKLGGIYALRDLNISQTTYDWENDIADEASFITFDEVDRPTTIVNATVCADEIIRNTCIRSTCDAEQDNCTYESGDYIETACSNECGEPGIAICSIDGDEMLYEECNAPVAIDDNNNGIADCIDTTPEEPELTVETPSQEPDLPATEEDAQEIVDAILDDSPTEADGAETPVTLDGGYAMNSGVISCSLNQTSAPPQSLLALWGFLTLFMGLIVFKRISLKNKKAPSI